MMCEACDTEDAGPAVGRSKDSLERARQIEARMPGERVPDEAWAIFEGASGGAIQWPHLTRLHECYEKAEDELGRSVAFRAA